MKKYIITIGVIVALIIAFVAVRIFSKKTKTQIIVNTTKITRGTIVNEVTATGTIEPVDQIEVGTQVSGTVSKIYVDYNSTVKKKQLLAELDKTNLNAALTNTQAAYNAAQNELLYQQQNYNRQKAMYEAQVISKSDFEAAEYKFQNAKSSLKQSEALLSTAKTNLGYASIYSPIDGVILTKEVEEGQTVNAGYSTPTLFTIARDITRMQVEADVDEADIGNVHEGQRVSFTVDAYPDEEFAGKVTQVRLGPTTTSNVVTYTVIVEVNNSDQKLKPGLTATITIYTKELKDVMVVSAQALNFIPDSTLLARYYSQKSINEGIPKINNHEATKGVWVIKSNGALEFKTVTTGDKDGINVQIVSGLSIGQEAVLNITEIESKKASGGSSPFMPTPPKQSKKAN